MTTTAETDVRVARSAAPRPSRRSRRGPALLAALGAACVVAGAALFADSGDPVGAVPAPGPAVATAVAGTMPVTVTLPARGVSAPVVAVGTAADGSLAVPAAPSTVGWWSPGALTGAATGSVVLAGHVDSREAGLGIFAVLPELALGEPVRLHGADGRDVDYRVVARREYPKAALPTAVFARDGAPRLVLITCGGHFDPATRSYDHNVVVYAEPTPPA
jgi:hypothetical protein